MPIVLYISMKKVDNSIQCKFRIFEREYEKGVPYFYTIFPAKKMGCRYGTELNAQASERNFHCKKLRLYFFILFS